MMSRRRKLSDYQRQWWDAAAPVAYSPLTTLPDLDDYHLSTLGVGDTGGDVDSWESQILAHIVTSSGTARPTLITGANGVQAIEFDGSDDVLDLASGYDLIGAAETSAYMAIVRTVQANSGADTCVSVNTSSNGREIHLRDTNGPTATVLLSNDQTLGGTGTAAQGTVESVECWGTGGNIYISLDGTDKSAVWTTGQFAATAKLHFSNTNGFGHSQMDIYEYSIQVGSIPSSAQRSAWRDATYTRYGHSGA